MHDRYNAYKVTLGEILVSTVIALVLVAIGFIISNLIVTSIERNNEKYDGVIKFSSDEQELFKYSMRTNVGNSFVNGDFKAVDTISLDELQGEYIYIEKIKERYTEKTRKEKDKNGKEVEVKYKEWDRVGSDSYSNQFIEFMGVKFASNKFDFSSHEERLDLNSNSVYPYYSNKVRGNYLYNGSKSFWSVGDIRYKYVIVPCEFTGTIFAKLSNNDITGVDSKKIRVNNMSIDEFLVSVESESKIALVVFWTLWIIGIGVLLFFFVRKRNKWADIYFNKRS